jgi:hypothetical protein
VTVPDMPETSICDGYGVAAACVIPGQSPSLNVIGLAFENTAAGAADVSAANATVQATASPQPRRPP